MRNILGATWSKSQTFPDHKKTTSLKFLKILNVDSQRSSPRSFKGRGNRILGALSRLDDFFTNPLIQGHSGTAPETCRNAFGTNQGANEDDSQSDPHPEAGIVQSQTAHKSGPEVVHDVLTVVHEEVTNCSLGTSSGKQTKNRSASQP